MLSGGVKPAGIRYSVEQGALMISGKFWAMLALGCMSMTGFAAAAQGHKADGSGAPPALEYEAGMRAPVPVPPSERALQTATAELWFQVPGKGRVLEGIIFDENGDLLFCDVTERRILRLTPDRKLSTVIAPDALAPAGLALRQDGRLFIAAVDLAGGKGAILSVESEGGKPHEVVPQEAGYMPDDLFFDAQGGLYFTDFKGSATMPEGGVYYVAPDASFIKPVLPHLAKANGIALSPDGKTLWATEYARNALHRLELAGPATMMPVGSTIAYYFVGPAPDSLEIDADGNVYVAMHRQGRALVFNRNGIPIGQILMPGRDQGAYLKSTSMAISPKTRDC